MKRHGLLWIVGAAVLIAGHGAILYYVQSHMALSMTIIAGVLVVVIVKHLGWLGLLGGLLWKALRRPK